MLLIVMFLGIFLNVIASRKGERINAFIICFTIGITYFLLFLGVTQMNHPRKEKMIPTRIQSLRPFETEEAKVEWLTQADITLEKLIIRYTTLPVVYRQYKYKKEVYSSDIFYPFVIVVPEIVLWKPESLLDIN